MEIELDEEADPVEELCDALDEEAETVEELVDALEFVEAKTLQNRFWWL